MPSDAKPGLGTLSTVSIGIGGMVGGGIFAVTGLAIEVTKGSAPFAFIIAGVIALLTSYSYLKLTLRYPGEGGTVDFLNRGFGGGVLTGAANILLLLSYVVLLAVYAYAFGSYGARALGLGASAFWIHALTSGVIIGLVLVNVFASKMVIRSENVFNIAKLALLAVFIVAGLLTPMDWTRLGPEHAVTPIGMVAGAMLIFLNYEGFELIANASKDVKNPGRSLPIAFIGGVLLVIVIYVAIVAVVIGHLSFAEVSASSDTALSAAGDRILGPKGGLLIAVAALLATSSAINATFYSTGRLTYIVAKTGELPRSLEREFRGEHFEGVLISAGLALIVANFVPLEAIATMGSAGFLLLFFAVNVAAFRLAAETGGRALISALAALSTAIALVVLCVEVDENPATRNHLWILAGMIGVSLAIEIVYRRLTGRKIRPPRPVTRPPGV